MYKNTRRRLLMVAVLVIIAGIICLPSEIPVKLKVGSWEIDKTFRRRGLNIAAGNVQIKRDFDLKLGLDLVGGSRLVFEADTTGLDEKQKENALASLREVVARRVNLFGVAEPNIQSASFGGNDRVIVELPGVRETQKAIEIVGKTASLIFAEVIGGEEEQSLELTDLTGADLTEAKVSFDGVTGKPVVLIEFNDGGEKKFAELTERNVGRQLPIILDGQVISAPVVRDKIVGGSAQITGDFSLDEAKELVIQLNAGALPVPVELVSERTVGATLGKESVERSVRAGLVGLGLVLIFMVVFYGKLGLVADAGLIIFGILTLALYKVIPVVLTLPGIAGFLLSVGMAVDSNILVFERFREERRKGVNIIWSLETSFDRAWDSIKDANIATLVTAFVLVNPFEWQFLNTSGPVRGFAITLAIGIGVSLFTGIFVSRNLLRFFIREEKEK